MAEKKITKEDVIKYIENQETALREANIRLEERKILNMSEDEKIFHPVATLLDVAVMAGKEVLFKKVISTYRLGAGYHIYWKDDYYNVVDKVYSKGNRDEYKYKVIPFDDWFNSLGIDILNNDSSDYEEKRYEEIFRSFSFNEIKNFFIDQLRTIYNKKIDVMNSDLENEKLKEANEEND